MKKFLTAAFSFVILRTAVEHIDSSLKAAEWDSEEGLEFALPGILLVRGKDI